MIQQLVDFFYIVGAPEEEIEKLNVVGESINPDRIGSWINVSEKGGIDGGWCFTSPINLEVAINSVEQGPICEQVILLFFVVYFFPIFSFPSCAFFHSHRCSSRSKSGDARTVYRSAFTLPAIWGLSRRGRLKFAAGWSQEALGSKRN